MTLKFPLTHLARSFALVTAGAAFALPAAAADNRKFRIGVATFLSAPPRALSECPRPMPPSSWSTR